MNRRRIRIVSDSDRVTRVNKTVTTVVPEHIQ